MVNIDIRFLDPSDIKLLRQIDRTEQLQVEYRVENGKLVSSATNAEVPPWDTSGCGNHSVNHLIAFGETHLDQGAQLLGAFREGSVVGIAVVDPAHRPGVGWLARMPLGARMTSAAGRSWSDAQIALSLGRLSPANIESFRMVAQ